MNARSFLTGREVRQPSRYCSKSKRKTLQERIAVKLKGETIGEALDAWERDGKCYPDWRPEVMVACRTMRYEFDESNPVVGADFVSALSLVYDKHDDEEPPPGILATKVIDYCKRRDILWPRDFQAHGDRLRAAELPVEVATGK